MTFVLADGSCGSEFGDGTASTARQIGSELVMHQRTREKS